MAHYQYSERSGIIWFSSKEEKVFQKVFKHYNDNEIFEKNPKDMVTYGYLIREMLLLTYGISAGNIKEEDVLKQK